MLEKIKEAIASVLELPVEKVGDDFSQKTQPLWDSLNHLNIIIALEEKTGLSFEPEEIAVMTSIIAIAEIIKNKS